MTAATTATVMAGATLALTAASTVMSAAGQAQQAGAQAGMANYRSMKSCQRLPSRHSAWR